MVKIRQFWRILARPALPLIPGPKLAKIVNFGDFAKKAFPFDLLKKLKIYCRFGDFQSHQIDEKALKSA